MNEKLYNDFKEYVKNKVKAGEEVEVTVKWCRDHKLFNITTADTRAFGPRFKREYKELDCELAELGTRANYVYIKKKTDKKS